MRRERRLQAPIASERDTPDLEMSWTEASATVLTARKTRSAVILRLTVQAIKSGNREQPLRRLRKSGCRKAGKPNNGSGNQIRKQRTIASTALEIRMQDRLVNLITGLTIKSGNRRTNASTAPEIRMQDKRIDPAMLPNV